MTFQTIEVRKLNPMIGAEIHGVDLSRSLSNRQAEEIHQAWMDNLVIVFRDQQLTVDQHLEFARHFGQIHVHPSTVREGRRPEFIEIKSDAKSWCVYCELWHSDVSCEAEPPMGSLLQMLEVPPDGAGDTLFSNMYLAYETLSEPIKQMLLGLTAIHDSKHVFPNDSQFPRCEHPIVRTHPVTGRKALYVNSLFTTHIVGLNRNESTAILEMLFRHMETPEFSFRVHWSTNTLTCWDNRCAQHRAVGDYHPHNRLGRRVTISGDRPFLRCEEVPVTGAAERPLPFNLHASA